ncbi:Beta-hexosaminidase [Mycena indigotica]|uniref:Beta-hexosaminidase n=1 Tax=Mycena indigotica TaxID=2126181 RepID=A0A8H6SJJ4_9AGAR|nr:Beta-hexosaminidase [Mycena indigotica]KAF7299472.1 Beta-hexosaminidase [Mycena indigotica]
MRHKTCSMLSPEPKLISPPTSCRFFQRADRGASNATSFKVSPTLASLTITLQNTTTVLPIATEAVKDCSSRIEGYTLAIPKTGAPAVLSANSTSVNIVKDSPAYSVISLTFANESPAGHLRLATPATVNFTTRLITATAKVLPGKYFSAGGDALSRHGSMHTRSTSAVQNSQAHLVLGGQQLLWAKQSNPSNLD